MGRVLAAGLALFAATGCTPAGADGGQGTRAAVLLAAAGALTPTIGCTPQAGAGTVEVTGEGADLALRAVKAAGWPEGQWRQALRVMGAESGYDAAVDGPTVVLRNGTTVDHDGLFQVQSSHVSNPRINPAYPQDRRKDPVVNATMALRLWEQAGGEWDGPWLASRDAWPRYDTAAEEALRRGGVDDVSTVALAQTGAEPCVPGPGGTTGAEGALAAPACSEGTTETVATPDGSTQVCRVIPGLIVSVKISGSVMSLIADAAEQGLTLAGSGWRSHQRQRELYAQNCSGGRCSPPTAVPGTSEHEHGDAVDFTCNGVLITSAKSPCYAFLVENAPSRGLHQLPSEKWHWSDDGT